jgi:hypothetical protein
MQQSKHREAYDWAKRFRDPKSNYVSAPTTMLKALVELIDEKDARITELEALATEQGGRLIMEQIEALTMADVDAAKQRRQEARATRSGLSTADFVLAQVDGQRKTLDGAKAYLLSLNGSPADGERQQP